MTAPSEAELEALAARLEATKAYRILRAVSPPRRLDTLPDGARIGVYLDLETTGLDPAGDAVIELGLVRFAYRDDEVLGMLDEIAAFEDPGRPIPPEITRLTGIDDAMVAGRRLDEARVREACDQAALVVAHNAGFDRPFAERRFPWLAEVAWACSLRDVPWRDEGFEGSGLQPLVMASGGFFDGHRAIEDCYAGVFLLGLRLPRSGVPVLTALRRSAARREVRLWAVSSPFETKDLLRGRGYRWSAVARCWWCDVPEAAVVEEETWLAEFVYGGRVPRLPRRPLDAWCRYSDRVSDSPS
jgi:DNA polymerase III subunit epsilon